MLKWDYHTLLLILIKTFKKCSMETIPCVKSVRIGSYSVRMQEIADENNFEYGHFSPCDSYFTKMFCRKRVSFAYKKWIKKSKKLKDREKDWGQSEKIVLLKMKKK